VARSPKADVFSIVRLCAIETKNNLFLSAARDAIAKHRHFLALACALFETKNNLKGEDLRYDCYYHY